VPAQPFDEVSPPEEQTGLRPTEQLVGARGDQRGAVSERGGGVWLIGQ
jgi:hypothetical protein